MHPWKVIYRYQGRRGSASFGSEAGARDFVTAMRKRGVTNIYCTPV